MIIEPDFFEHWKTKALLELTGRPESPLWVQRLWGHCQTRKMWKFPGLTPLALKSVCGVPRSITPENWKEILIKAGFITMQDDTICVHDWEVINAALVKNWRNGNKPKTKPNGSHDEAKAMPSGGHGAATDDPAASDRVDRLEGEDRGEGGDGFTPPTVSDVSSYSSSLSITEIEKFLDHHAAGGWRFANGRRITDWQAAVRLWVHRREEYEKKNAPGVSAASATLLPFNPNLPNAHTGGLEVFEATPEDEEAKQ